jgi:hypothetical protein
MNGFHQKKKAGASICYENGLQCLNRGQASQFHQKVSTSHSLPGFYYQNNWVVKYASQKEMLHQKNQKLLLVLIR